MASQSPPGSVQSCLCSRLVPVAMNTKDTDPAGVSRLHKLTVRTQHHAIVFRLQYLFRAGSLPRKADDITGPRFSSFTNGFLGLLAIKPDLSGEVRQL